VGRSQLGRKQPLLDQGLADDNGIGVILRETTIVVRPTAVGSSGDTIPNRLGEFREIRESKERTGVAAYGPIRQARLEQPELSGSSQERYGLRSDGDERGETV